MTLAYVRTYINMHIQHLCTYVCTYVHAMHTCKTYICLYVYLLYLQILGGIAQSTGWPGVVAVMANWFGKGKLVCVCMYIRT